MDIQKCRFSVYDGTFMLLKYMQITRSGIILIFIKKNLKLLKFFEMRSRTSTWFETKVRLERMQEDGTEKKVTEQYVVDALSFTEAESSIIDEMSVYTSGELQIKDIKPAAYGEIFFSDMEKDDKWYKAKLQFITIDEKTEKEKKSTVNYLVQAGSLPLAVKHIDEVMGSTMIDYVISSIAESPIIDVFEHHAPKDKNKSDESKDDVPEFLKESDTSEAESADSGDTSQESEKAERPADVTE